MGAHGQAVRFKRSIRSILASCGFEVRRVKRSREGSGEAAFYRPEPSCQIKDLGRIYELIFGRVRDGYFVEVGAYDGRSFSNTSCLADVGWSGLLIEPVPYYAELCRQRYRATPRIRIVESAVGTGGDDLVLTVAEALTTANPQLAEEYRNLAWAKSAFECTHSIAVRQRRLDHILEASAVEPGFDLLSVDVEGFEAAVFDGFDLARFRPKMMIVELSDFHFSVSSTRCDDAALTKRILEHGYVIVYKDPINTVFVSEG